MPARQTNIVAIINQKGGVGKTTTAINLAAYLSRRGRTILLVDADPQANTTSGLGVPKTPNVVTLGDILMGREVAENGIIKTKIPGVSLLPAHASLASVEMDLANLTGRETKLKLALRNLAGYDYILIDCPPALGLLTINALTSADQVLIPVQAEYFALEGLSQLLQVMQQVKQSLNPELELLGVVLTMFDKRTGLAQQVQSEIHKHFENKLFKTVIPRNVRLAESPSHGLSIMEYDKWSKGARAYKSLAKEVDQRVQIN